MARTQEAAPAGSIKHMLEGAMVQAQQGRSTQVALDRLDANPYQHRTDLDAEKLDELAGSIATSGLLQPITVRAAGDRWQIIAGHRRAAAYRLLSSRASSEEEGRRWLTIPAMEKTNVSEEEMLRLSLTENLHRDDPSALDSAASLAEYQNRYQLTTAQLAEKMNLGIDKVQRLLRLSTAPQVVKDGVTKGVMVPLLDDEGNPAKTPSGRAKQEHRHLDLLAALEFTKLHEHLAHESPKKANDRVEAVVRRALEESWGFRRIKSHCADMRVAKPHEGTQEGAGEPTPKRGSDLFREKDGVLTVFRKRLAAAAPQSRLELVALLEALLAEARQGMDGQPQ